MLVLIALAAGCGTGEPKCIPVSGKVTLDGGKVPGPGFIYFTTDGTGKVVTSRPGTAEFDAEGNYRAQTFTTGDGLLPGVYARGLLEDRAEHGRQAGRQLRAAALTRTRPGANSN